MELDHERLIRALRMTTPEELIRAAEAAHPDDEEAQAEWMANEIQRLYDAAGSVN